MKFTPLPTSRTVARRPAAARARRLELVADVLDRAEEQRAVDAQDIELRAQRGAAFATARTGAAAMRGSGSDPREARMRRAVEVDQQRREDADEDREFELDRRASTTKVTARTKMSPRLVRAIRRISAKSMSPTRRRTAARP